MDNETFDKIREASKKETKTIEQLLIKWMEELGEASQAFLSMQKVSGSHYKNLKIDDLKEELVDALLVNLDLIYKVGMTDIELKNICHKKIDKWVRKQNM
ncbi:hypothetical protein EFE32_12360 [Lactococcus lactis subsp. lactis]|uniref:hypothetical protein n=1 Tax=Lactococcus lactis TaxID=1358 RepID=UPI00223C2F60|nr:hypothetical protein [Lactococcus lactis]MCT0017567.1 hypothetical protein [Lactococcus lactis subsp. lactis]